MKQEKDEKKYVTEMGEQKRQTELRSSERENEEKSIDEGPRVRTRRTARVEALFNEAGDAFRGHSPLRVGSVSATRRGAWNGTTHPGAPGLALTFNARFTRSLHDSFVAAFLIMLFQHSRTVTLLVI